MSVHVDGSPHEAVADESSFRSDVPVVKADVRTTDGLPLYIHITLLEPEVVEKDGEKFMVYPVSTEVR